MWKDSIVAEVRKVREQYAARFGYDLEAIFRDLKAHEKASGRPVVSFAPKAVREDKVAVASVPDQSDAERPAQ